MQRRKQLQYAVIGVLGFALLFMTVGFAAYAQLVSNNDAAAISYVKPIHKIGFDADSYLQSTTSVTPSEKTITNDEISFKIRLEHPGDVYAAVINIVNHGNVAEILNEIDMTALDAAVADKIDYRLTFDDEDYIGTSYGVSNIINYGEMNRKQLFITVTYKDGLDAGAIDLDLAASLVFAQQ